MFSISWDSTDDEINQFGDYNFEDDESTVASRTRSHTPPNHHQDKKQVRHFFRLFFLFEFFFL